MLSADRKRQLLTDAESLAAELVRGEVSRTELRPVLNLLFLPPLPWSDRLARARELVAALPGSWLTERSKTAPRQYAQVNRTLEKLLRRDWDEDELRFLLGWVARKVPSRNRKTTSGPHSGERSRRGERGRR